MKKKIAFVISFLQLPTESGNDRFLDIASMLNPEVYEIEFIYSSFSHLKKQQRKIQQIQLPYKFTMITEPGYKKNISIRRFYSHYRFARNVSKYLHSKHEVDVIYCSIPSLSIGKVCRSFCRKHHKEFIVDIQDLWPDAFKLVIDNPILEYTVYRYLQNLANKIYLSADKIFAVSKTYLLAAKRINHHAKAAYAYLGTNYSMSYINTNEIEKKKGDIWLVYIGTIGKSYNISLCIKVVKYLYDKGYKNLSFVVVGDGPDLEACKNLSISMNSPTVFLGRQPYEKMMKVLQECDIAINPIRKKSAASVINKVGDYAMAGLPVINLQDSEEYRLVLEEYNAGFNCETDNEQSASNALESLITNERLRTTMSENSKRLAVECFYRNKTYKNIITLIDN